MSEQLFDGIQSILVDELLKNECSDLDNQMQEAIEKTEIEAEAKIEEERVIDIQEPIFDQELQSKLEEETRLKDKNEYIKEVEEGEKTTQGLEERQTKDEESKLIQEQEVREVLSFASSQKSLGVLQETVENLVDRIQAMSKKKTEMLKEEIEYEDQLSEV